MIEIWGAFPSPHGRKQGEVISQAIDRHNDGAGSALVESAQMTIHEKHQRIKNEAAGYEPAVFILSVVPIRSD